jgi:hypothetical protein
MGMSKDGRTILRFAVLGLVMAAVFFMFDKTDFFSKSWPGIWIFWASLVICPAWFFVFVVVVNATEVPVPDSALVWLIVGLVNCLYYATIGVVYVDMRKPRGSMAKI